MQLPTPEASTTRIKNKKYKCHLCPSNGKIFSTKAIFIRHVHEKHSARLLFKCPYPDCGLELSRKDKLGSHMCRHEGWKAPSLEAVPKREFLPPSLCVICANPVTSWREYIDCVAKHCEFDGETSPVSSTRATKSPDLLAENNCAHPWDFVKPVLQSSNESHTQDDQSATTTPAKSYHGCDEKSRSRSAATDSGDSEIYGDSDSMIVGEDEIPMLEQGLSGKTTGLVKTLYANCLYNLVYRQVFYSCPANGGGPTSNAPCRSQSSTISKGKRNADHIYKEQSGGDGQNDDNGDSGPSRPRKLVRSQETSPRRLACPFFKRHPEIFRPCGMSDHESPSRVKLHISRKHKLPIYCPRCSQVFKCERERDSHVRQNSCPVKPQTEWICATSEKLQRLSKRSQGHTDRDKWNEIYNILFPGCTLPDSPYLDSTVSAEVNFVREAFLNAAPIATRTAIQHAIPEALRGTCAEELERVILSTHVEVFDRILSRMQPGQSGTPNQSSVASDSGMGQSVNTGDEIPEEGFPVDYQATGQENRDVIGFDNDNLFSDPPALPLSENMDDGLAQMLLQFPSDWSFDIPGDLPAGMH